MCFLFLTWRVHKNEYRQVQNKQMHTHGYMLHKKECKRESLNLVHFRGQIDLSFAFTWSIVAWTLDCSSRYVALSRTASFWVFTRKLLSILLDRLCTSKFANARLLYCSLPCTRASCMVQFTEKWWQPVFFQP